MRFSATLRCVQTSAAILIFLLGLASSASQAAAAASCPSVTPAVGVPPIGGLFDQGLDLGVFGYEAAEFFVAGTASSYHNDPGEPFTGDGMWTVEADAEPTPAYKTRIHVAKPSDPSQFTGTVYVEWFNATSGRDGAAFWGSPHIEMVRQGAAYVGVSAQAGPVLAAIFELPGRYGPAGANLMHPGDSYSIDIFSQVGQCVRDEADLLLGPDYSVERVAATGQSQSASWLVTYANALGEPLGVYDGYFLHARGTGGRPLRGEIVGPPALPEIPVPSPTQIRTDLTARAMTFQTETDSRAARQDDSARFRWWEVAGTAHADAYQLTPLPSMDYGDSSEPAEELFDLMLHPIYQPMLGFPLPPCNLPLNAGPQTWIVRAAVFHLNNWLTDGTLPPIADRLATVGGSPTGALILDEHGNATGGIRTPHVDVPVATLRGSGNSPGFCFLFGTTDPFSEEKLAELYPNHGSFLSQWNQSVDTTMEAGFMLFEEAEWVKVSASKSTVGK